MTDPVATIVPAKPAALAPVESEIGSIIRMAVESKADIESLKALVALKNQQDDRESARQFYDAMAEFQRACPTIKKNRVVDFVTKAGQRVKYAHASLDEIQRQVKGPLNAVGLSFTWESEVKDGKMIVKCTVRHRDGHAQSASFISMIDGTSTMSDSQKAGGAVTFAQRYSLIQALGLTTAEDDVDGTAPGQPDGMPDDAERPPEPTVTEEQAANLRAMLDEAPDAKGERVKVCGWMKVETLADIPAREFTRVRNAIEAKRAKGWKA